MEIAWKMLSQLSLIDLVNSKKKKINLSGILNFLQTRYFCGNCIEDLSQRQSQRKSSRSY